MSHAKLVREAEEKMRAVMQPECVHFGKAVKVAVDMVELWIGRVITHANPFFVEEQKYRERLEDLLNRLAYPERYENESHSQKWHSGDGPFETWAGDIADKYKALVEKK